MAFNDEVADCLERQAKINDRQIEINKSHAGVIQQFGISGLQTKRTVIALIGYLRDNGGITLDQAAELHRLLYEDMSK